VIDTPYSLTDTLRLPYFYLFPTAAGVKRAPRRPLAHDFGKDGPTLRLVLLGDLMALRRWQMPGISAALTALMQSADLVVGNCEGPVVEHSFQSGSKAFLIRERLTPGYLHDLLERLGIVPSRCILSVSNNHSGDWGRGGLEKTVEHLNELGVIVVGHRSDGATPLITQTLGELTLGITAWTQLMNTRILAEDEGVWRLPDVEARPWAAIKREQGIDCLIATPHWGHEFRHAPTAQDRELARRLAAEGFDLIAGHHPHVLQTIEWFGPTVCLYSSGTLCGPAMPLTWPMRLSGVLEVRLVASGPEKGRIAAYRLHPFVQVGRRNRRIVPVEMTPGRLRRRITKRLSLLFAGAGVG
jgi:poly-gamma-glutamate synthesis protein (capsule biosynthesis protein)